MSSPYCKQAKADRDSFTSPLLIWGLLYGTRRAIEDLQNNTAWPFIHLCKACNLPGHSKVGAGQHNNRGQSACPAGVSTPTVSCLAIQRMNLSCDWQLRHPGAVFMFCWFLATNLSNLMLTFMCCHVTGHVIPDYIWLLNSKTHNLVDLWVFIHVKWVSGVFSLFTS